MKSLIIATGLATALASVALAQMPVLKVYTYSSFVSDWGPGPQVETNFEQTCSCDLQFVAVDSSSQTLSRIMLEGQRTDADILLGIDTNLTDFARESGLFANHGKSLEWDLPVPWTDPVFLPFDWGYFAFVYDSTRLANPPADFRELAGSDVSIVIQDPRSSTPGLGLLLWVKHAYGDEAGEIWSGLADNIVTVTPGWSESYGMFLDGDADMVLSYTTSPAYHLVAEGDDTKKSAAFTEGHYMQIEVAAKVASTDQPRLADAFLEFMASNGFQSVIPHTNWMYPAINHGEGPPEGFDTLHVPDKSLLFPPAEAEIIRRDALSEWQAALSQ